MQNFAMSASRRLQPSSERKYRSLPGCVSESDLRSSTWQLDSSSGEAGCLKRQTADSLMLASYDNLDESQYGANWRSRRQAKLILLKHTELRPRLTAIPDGRSLACSANRANDTKTRRS